MTQNNLLILLMKFGRGERVKYDQLSCGQPQHIECQQRVMMYMDVRMSREDRKSEGSDPNTVIQSSATVM